MTEIKLCGLYQDRDIDDVNELLPDYCGFVLNFPKSHRNLSLEQATRMKFRLNPSIRAVGVFVDQPLEVVAGALMQGVIDIAQLHGSEDKSYIRALQVETGKPVWKAFQIRSIQDIEEAKQSPADRLLLDRGQGTGETFDWSLIGELSRAWMLAGGLTPENLPQALEQLHPTGVDLSSGIETNKQKDREKMRRAVSIAHAM